MKKAPSILTLAAAVLLFWNQAIAAETKNTRKINWSEPQTATMPNGETNNFIFFNGAQYDLSENAFPFYYETIKLNGKPSSVSFEIQNATYVPVTESEKEVIAEMKKEAQYVFPNQIETNTRTGVIKKHKTKYHNWYYAS